MQQPRSQQSRSESPNKHETGGNRPPTAIDAYWAIYGKWRALVGSPYLWIAVVLTVVCFPLWTATENGVRVWAQNAVDIVPGMLGFSLGGMAILLAFANPRLLKVVREGGKVDSLFMKTVASFFHFILLQTVAVCLALVTKSYSNDVVSAVGFFFMCYGTLVAVAVAGLLLNISRIFNSAASLDEK
jgi:hypothetical protein